VKVHAFLTSLKLYLLLTGLDFPDDQLHIHWALSYFKSRYTATFDKHVVRQEMKSGVIIFADWNDFTLKFTSTFCPENEATAALMRLESDYYLQGRHNIDVHLTSSRTLLTYLAAWILSP
jgi:hypothetical protein